MISVYSNIKQILTIQTIFNKNNLEKKIDLLYYTVSITLSSVLELRIRRRHIQQPDLQQQQQQQQQRSYLLRPSPAEKKHNF